MSEDILIQIHHKANATLKLVEGIDERTKKSTEATDVMQKAIAGMTSHTQIMAEAAKHNSELFEKTAETLEKIMDPEKGWPSLIAGKDQIPKDSHKATVWVLGGVIAFLCFLMIALISYFTYTKFVLTKEQILIERQKEK